ncbi:hypothetical protein [Streptomyces sp. NPDC057428]|uniref:hypothetical protein n=1 Tax=Streptomyces sp. NPDC057428 TaxID=3346129 RepID=UPI0036736EE9
MPCIARRHAPMAVEALAARGQARSVHRRLDLYAPRLEEFPTAVEPVTEAGWRTAASLAGIPSAAFGFGTAADHLSCAGTPHPAAEPHPPSWRPAPAAVSCIVDATYLR